MRLLTPWSIACQSRRCPASRVRTPTTNQARRVGRVVADYRGSGEGWALVIVSHEHKFIFLKTMKTAGTSVEIALSRHCGPDDIITATSPGEEELRREYAGRGPQNHDLGHRLLYSHMKASRVRQLVGPEVWAEYFKFTVERNPWDAVVSSYSWVTRERPGSRERQSMTFEEFLERVPSMRSNSSIYRIRGEVAVDKVCRYESLADDLEEVRQRLGLPPLELPHAKGGFRDERHYRTYYRPEDVERVRTWFADTIETFGYDF
jgi:hypothetical protein